jgi:hypothetical protein
VWNKRKMKIVGQKGVWLGENRVKKQKNETENRKI